MRFVVVDASVAAKWYVPEIHTISALKLLDGTFGLCAPDLLPSELGNILWKKVHRGEIGQDKAEGIIADYETAPITYHSSLSLLSDAFKIATETKRTVYDSLYLALAEAQGSSLVTADQRFYNALQTSRYSTSLLWIENL